jgi:hypothetical protein
MGVSESKEVYLVGEVDYRVIAWDQPSKTNLGLRHLTPVDEKLLPTSALVTYDDTLLKLMQYTILNRGPVWFQADNVSILPLDPLMHPPITDPPLPNASTARLCTRVIIKARRYASSKFATECHILNLQIAPEHPQFGYARK